MTNSHLEELARAATPGPWERERGVNQGAWIARAEKPDQWVALACGDTPEEAIANADYITAFDPTTCLSLLQDLSSARARVKELEEALKPFAQIYLGAKPLDAWAGSDDFRRAASLVKERGDG